MHTPSLDAAIEIALQLSAREQAVLVEEIVASLAQKAEEHADSALESPQRGILEIPSLHLDPRHPALTMLSREDMYGDDGR